MTTPALTDAQIDEALAQLHGWAREGNHIHKTYTFGHYLEGTAFASAVGVICEAHDHHPDLHIGYKTVRVSFTTHDAGHAISHKDIAAAQAIDALGYPKAQ
jgi:4a-hydroxytetrahydrobiopterin dehydratase